jgi:hypothetical protein
MYSRQSVFRFLHDFRFLSLFSPTMPRSEGTPWVASLNKEVNKLRNKESNWNLAVGGTTTRRTRHGGNGRPSYGKRYHDELLESSSESESNSSTDTSVDEGLDGVQIVDASFFTDEISSESSEDEEFTKPPPHNLLIETIALTETLEKNCRCQQCNGPVLVSYKTITIASSIEIQCKDEDCGYHYNGPSLLVANLHENDDDRERITDYAINIQYVLAMEALKLHGSLDC